MLMCHHSNSRRTQILLSITEQRINYIEMVGRLCPSQRCLRTLQSVPRPKTQTEVIGSRKQSYLEPSLDHCYATLLKEEKEQMKSAI